MFETTPTVIILERFLAKVPHLPRPLDSSCWIWTGSTNGNGYGEMRIDGRKTYAHRVSHELYIGPIPVGYDIDHLCRNHGCVSPFHIEAVTRRTNTMRGKNPDVQRARAAAVTHCPHGHLYDAANTYRTKAGLRQCRTCNRERNRRRREAARA